MNPTPFKKVLRNLNWHICGTHFLIAFLKLLRDFKDFISSGTWLNIFGPRQDTLSFPLKIVSNDRILKIEWFLRLRRFWI